MVQNAAPELVICEIDAMIAELEARLCTDDHAAE